MKEMNSWFFYAIVQAPLGKTNEPPNERTRYGFFHQAGQRGGGGGGGGGAEDHSSSNNLGSTYSQRTIR